MAEPAVATGDESGGGASGRRAQLRLVLVAVLVAAVLAGVVPLALLQSVVDTGRSRGWLLTLPLVVYAGARIAVLIARGRPMLFDFFFLLFVYIFMGIAPTVQIRSGEISTTTDGMDYALDVPTAGIVWLGVGCYELARLAGLLLTHRRGAASPGTPASPASATLTATGSSTANPVAVARVSPLRAGGLLLLGLAASAYFVNAVGSATLFTSRDQAFTARNAAFPDPALRSIFYALAIYPLLVGVGAATQLRRSSIGPTRRLWALLALAGTALLLIVVNPISSARYSLGTVLFALAVYAGATTTRLRTRVTLAATIGGFVFLFPLADAFRYSDRGVSASRAGFFAEYAGNGDYDAFWQIANSWSYVVDGLVEPGRQILGSLFFWVPRSIWGDKPVDTGILLAQYREYDFDNLSAPLWAEALVNGGLVAVVLAFVVLGVLLLRFDARLVPAFAQSGFWAVVGAIFPVYMTILLRGSLLQATGAVAVAGACLVAVYRPAVRARPGPAPGQRPGPPLLPTSGSGHAGTSTRPVRAPTAARRDLSARPGTRTSARGPQR